MTGTERIYFKDGIYDHINSLCEKVCEFCKWKSEYKDPDDLEKEQCSICQIFETAEEIKEEIDQL